MRALYPMRIALPSLVLGTGLLCGCGQSAPGDSAQATPQEPWPNEYEMIFQEAEALKFTLQQHRLEEQRLYEAGLPANPPAPLQ